MSEKQKKETGVDRRVFNGGPREGAGRPISISKKNARSFLVEQIVVKQQKDGQVRDVKKTRETLLFEMLFKLGYQHGDVRAIDRLFYYADRRSKEIDEKNSRFVEANKGSTEWNDKVYKALDKAYGGNKNKATKNKQSLSTSSNKIKEEVLKDEGLSLTLERNLAKMKAAIKSISENK
ncbi:MAG: hypothetical protein V4438_01520 [Patescibacteria group bacterium]